LAELTRKFFNISVNSARKINEKLPGRVGLAELVLARVSQDAIFSFYSISINTTDTI
jgi:hypothetical protein